MALGKCSYYGEKNCKFSHAGVAGSNRDHAVDKQGNCGQFKKHGYYRRLERGNCPFLHNKKGTGEPDSLSAEQHGAVMVYAEANSLDPTTIKWSTEAEIHSSYIQGGARVQQDLGAAVEGSE